MSAFTREQILELLQSNTGLAGIDLSGVKLESVKTNRDSYFHVLWRTGTKFYKTSLCLVGFRSGSAPWLFLMPQVTNNFTYQPMMLVEEVMKILRSVRVC